MSDYTRVNMTPGNTADCYLPGCIGVSGGLCVGALPSGAPANQTLWWCCTPYASTCRGGAQPSCSDKATTCTGASGRVWCCSGELEVCPGSDATDGSCVPKDFVNPAQDGPVWGPGAVNLNATSSIPPTASSTTAKSSSPAAATVTVTAETSGLAPGAAAGVGFVGGALAVLAIVSVVYCLRKKQRAKKRALSAMSMQSNDLKVTLDTSAAEVHGECLHEMEAGERV